MKIEPNFMDIDNLKKFISVRGKILSRKKTGVCAKHQRKLSKQIKYARYLALLPYVSYQLTK
jgi:small subunit ribosomal protein S18